MSLRASSRNVVRLEPDIPRRIPLYLEAQEDAGQLPILHDPIFCSLRLHDDTFHGLGSVDWKSCMYAQTFYVDP